MSTNRKTLAADNIRGVYVSEIPTDQIPFYDMDFYDYLTQVSDGEMVYGDVSDEIAERIEQDFGIN